jgi:predicted nucleic acid-binding protein
MKGIADTGFLVAFANRGDSHHDWAVEVARNVTEPLLSPPQKVKAGDMGHGRL